jgi:NTE family protein
MTVTAPPRIGLALGGGGARGLAHISVLEAFDELGLKPAAISGTSIGALIGAAYASGMTASEIRAYCKRLLSRRGALLRHVYVRWSGRIWDYWDPRTPSIFSAESIMRLVLPPQLPAAFEDLLIPLQTVASDFYTQSAYVSGHGPLLPALAASAALPALLKPVKLDGRILIDGGFVNPLPFDLLKEKADYVIAVDVCGGPGEGQGSLPGSMSAVIGAQQIALRAIINEKLKTAYPDLLVRPKVTHYRLMDFLHQDEILDAARDAKEEAKGALARMAS